MRRLQLNDFFLASPPATRTWPISGSRRATSGSTVFCRPGVCCRRCARRRPGPSTKQESRARAGRSARSPAAWREAFLALSVQLRGRSSVAACSARVVHPPMTPLRNSGWAIRAFFLDVLTGVRRPVVHYLSSRTGSWYLSKRRGSRYDGRSRSLFSGASADHEDQACNTRWRR